MRRCGRFVKPLTARVRDFALRHSLWLIDDLSCLSRSLHFRNPPAASHHQQRLRARLHRRFCRRDAFFFVASNPAHQIHSDPGPGEECRSRSRTMFCLRESIRRVGIVSNLRSSRLPPLDSVPGTKRNYLDPRLRSCGPLPKSTGAKNES